MQYTLVAAALVATVAATDKQPYGNAKVVNRCSYPVWLWPVQKQMGCPTSAAIKLVTGGVWQEPLSDKFDNGMSIKISKFDTCGGKDITQLEYKIDGSAKFGGNYLDMSFVDCTRNLEDCPGRTDGFYMKAGSQTGASISAVDNEHCPVFNVYNAEEAAKVSYINWDDRQTKWCQADQDLELYLCGGHAPGDDDSSSEPVSSASPSSEVESTPSPTSTSTSTKQQKPKPTPPASSSTEEAFVVAAAAAVTLAPAPAAPVIKTEVVYVTEYVNRRHAHGRRHQRHRA